ncbi:ferrous iron transport protein B, partial [Aliarcobacter butzleri]
IWLNLQDTLNISFVHLHLHYQTDIIDDFFNAEKFAFVKGVITKAVQQEHQLVATLTEIIDSLLLHNLLGVPLLVLVVWALF